MSCDLINSGNVHGEKVVIPSKIEKKNAKRANRFHTMLVCTPFIWRRRGINIKLRTKNKQTNKQEDKRTEVLHL